MYKNQNPNFTESPSLNILKGFQGLKICRSVKKFILFSEKQKYSELRHMTFLS